MRVAGRILVDRDQAGHARAALIFAAHGVARALRRDHQHVEIGARLDQIEMHVQAVREQQRRAFLHVGMEVVAIDGALQFVRGQHHDDVGPFGGLGHVHDLELLGLGLLGGSRALAQRDRHLLHAGIPQVQRMGVALAAIADDGDLLALDEVQVGIPVVINAHHQPLKWRLPAASLKRRRRWFRHRSAGVLGGRGAGDKPSHVNPGHPRADRTGSYLVSANIR
jgi:hypothetical protein